MAVRPGASSKQKVTPMDDSQDTNHPSTTNNPPNAPATESASSLEMAPLRPSELASRSQDSSDDSSSERPETSDVDDLEVEAISDLPIASNANPNATVESGAFALSNSGSENNDTFRYVDLTKVS